MARLEKIRATAQCWWPWLVLLLLLALSYYASYVRCGIGFRDEGQTVALCAQRLLNGELPLKGVVLSYNVLWFYPVVALFKFFGVNYVLLRGFCFALSTVAAVLAFFLVEKTTRRPWLAFLVGAVLVLVPGSTFKNYIPLMAVANSLCLLHVALTPADHRSSLWKAFIGGTVLGLSFLIRIDIALLFAAIWGGLLLLRGLFDPTPPARRALVAIASLAIVCASVCAVHLPVLLDAKRRGFAREFEAQYWEKWHLIAGPVRSLLHHHGVGRRTPRAAALPAGNPPLAAAWPGALVTAESITPGAKPEPKTLRRASLDGDSGDKHGAAEKVFFLLTYAPFVSLLAFLPWALIAFVKGWWRRDPELHRRGLAVLVVLGGALTTFPQFFFFRPDVPHLSEFMPCFLAAATASAGLVWTGASGWRNWRTLLTLLVAAHAALYVWRILPDRWAGTAAIRNRRTKFFTAENGVRVYVTPREYDGLTSIQKLLRDYAPRPEDYIVCYPYSPGINLLADRPTYERNVYIDNATRTMRWDAEAIARIRKFQPAVIVLSDWDINGSEASRFAAWAPQAKHWIELNYTSQGSYRVGSDNFEIFTRTVRPPS